MTQFLWRIKDSEEKGCPLPPESTVGWPSTQMLKLGVEHNSYRGNDVSAIIFWLNIPPPADIRASQA
jgi:hypothetical protein